MYAEGFGIAKNNDEAILLGFAELLKVAKSGH